MALFIVTFLAGILTVLAPCILPLLPVVLGGAVSDVTNRFKPYRIVIALGVSVFAFTFLLKVSTIFIMVPPSFWQYFSSAILFAFGLTLVFPALWDKIVVKLPGAQSGYRLMSSGQRKSGFWGDILVGASLGPIFTTCSPTFFVILATVLPQSLGLGVLHILVYVAGLCLSLFAIAFVGQRLVDKLGWASNPHGLFKKAIGVLFIVLALAIGSGYEKKLEIAILDSGYFDVTKLETYISKFFDKDEQVKISEPIQTTGETVLNLPDTSTTTDGDMETVDKQMESVTSIKMAPADKMYNFLNPRYVEIVKPSGFVNTEPFKLFDIVGKKVVLLDFMTYSCINCQRTFPYLNAWYEKYKDQGLEIVAFHTPEFAFEKDIRNVREAAERFGLKFPMVLDNNYDTWNAYRNRYWPHKYLVDIDGNIVYDHVGEGAYEETEQKIVELLKERKRRLGEQAEIDVGVSVEAYSTAAGSPETYFGAWRNNNIGNGKAFSEGEQEYVLPAEIAPNKYYLEGNWNIEHEFASNKSTDSKLVFKFTAKDVYIVAEADNDVSVRILIDGEPVNIGNYGDDVDGGAIKVKESRLYHIYSAPVPVTHTLELIIETPDLRAYTFTFG